MLEFDENQRWTFEDTKKKLEMLYDFFDKEPFIKLKEQKT